MTKKRVIQKLVTFESKNRDYKELNKELVGGWYIASIMPHNDSFLCVLEKKCDGGDEAADGISVKEALSIVAARKNKKLVLSNSE
jgi:hypothetical protein